MKDNLSLFANGINDIFSPFHIFPYRRGETDRNIGEFILGDDGVYKARFLQHYNLQNNGKFTVEVKNNMVTVSYSSPKNKTTQTSIKLSRNLPNDADEETLSARYVPSEGIVISVKQKEEVGEEDNGEFEIEINKGDE